MNVTDVESINEGSALPFRVPEGEITCWACWAEWDETGQPMKGPNRAATGAEQ